MAALDGPAEASVAAVRPNVACDFDARLAFLRALIRSEASHSASAIETHMS